MIITRAFLGWMAVIGAVLFADGTLSWIGAYSFQQSTNALLGIGLGAILMTIATASIKGLGLLAKVLRSLDRPSVE